MRTTGAPDGVSRTLTALPPSEERATQRQALNDWCKLRGIDSSIFDKEFHDPKTKAVTESVNKSYLSGITGFDGSGRKKTMTFQLVKMGESQTKVKLHFSGVLYPPELEAYYKMIWRAVDKQIFVDKNIEGSVEQRK